MPRIHVRSSTRSNVVRSSDPMITPSEFLAVSTEWNPHLTTLSVSVRDFVATSSVATGFKSVAKPVGTWFSRNRSKPVLCLEVAIYSSFHCGLVHTKAYPAQISGLLDASYVDDPSSQVHLRADKCRFVSSGDKSCGGHPILLLPALIILQGSKWYAPWIRRRFQTQPQQPVSDTSAFAPTPTTSILQWQEIPVRACTISRDLAFALQALSPIIQLLSSQLQELVLVWAGCGGVWFSELRLSVHEQRLSGIANCARQYAATVDPISALLSASRSF
ncbi:hypothetical protein FPV67DRAFT_1457451 [Lyophyllum atratum]|nr:hypothetical protein FPV67DRAFT_1457451 [Lyophyllum atratum]